MPELFGVDLPIWLLAILFLLSNKDFMNFLKRILSVFGIVAKREKEAEIDERQWRRNRDDKMFDVLKSLIDGFQAESKERDKILSTLTAALHKNTDTLARQIDMIRLLAYNASTVDEKLQEISDNIQTRWLRHEDRD